MHHLFPIGCHFMGGMVYMMQIGEEDLERIFMSLEVLMAA
jgi:hypothetical protein